jgi:hypothetical protein
LKVEELSLLLPFFPQLQVEPWGQGRYNTELQDQEKGKGGNRACHSLMRPFSLKGYFGAYPVIQGHMPPLLPFHLHLGLTGSHLHPHPVPESEHSPFSRVQEVTHTTGIVSSLRERAAAEMPGASCVFVGVKFP